MEVNFKFHGKDEALKLVDTHRELAKYLSNQSVECPLIGADIQIGKLLGQGKFGSAFIVTVPNFGPKEYAVKQINRTVGVEISPYQGSLQDVAKKLSKDLRISKKAIIDLNPGTYVQKGDKLYIPFYSKGCLTEEEENIPSYEGEGENILVPAGSYVCDDEVYPEFVISSLCGLLYQQGKSINFFDTFGFATCPTKRGVVDQYVFMEKIDTTLAKLILKEKVDSTALIMLIIQTIHAIGVYQTQLKLQHTDLSTKNIFIEYVKPNTKFNGKNLSKADKFLYIVNTSSGEKLHLYLPVIPWIVKVGDFGMSVKYKYPIVSSRDSLIGAENIPNWYTKNYDILFFINNLFHTARTEYVLDICRYLLKKSDADSDEIENDMYQFFSEDSGRPELWTLSSVFTHVTPEALLTSELTRKFRTKREKDSVVFMGEF